MKPIEGRSVGLARLSAPSFGFLDELEVKTLRQVQPWIRWLYLELVMLSNFHTGFVSVHRAKLLSLLDFDEAPNGGRRRQRATIKTLRDAIDELHGIGLVGLEAKRNRRTKALEIHVAAREQFRSPSVDLGRRSARRSGRPETAREANKHAGSGDSAVPVRADVGADVGARGSGQENLLSVGSPLVDKSAGPASIAKTLADVREELVQRSAARGRSRAPKGA